MKKWLTEATTSCGYQNKSLDEDSHGSSEKLQGISESGEEVILSDCTSPVTMGQAVRSQGQHSFSSEDTQAEECDSLHCSGELSHYHPPVNFGNSGIPALACGYHIPSLSTSIELHPPSVSCTSSKQISVTKSGEAQGNYSEEELPSASNGASCSNASDSVAPSESAVATNYKSKQVVEVSSDSTSICDSAICSKILSSDYSATSLPSTSRAFEQSSSQLSTQASGEVAAPGCGHWCSSCRVRVQVEVECVPSSQGSPNGNRRGVRPLTFPKRTRHKVKSATKDLNNCNHKKKKSPWSFRLNYRLRHNKNENDHRSVLSSLNMGGCASCVCPGYRRTEAESTYRSIDNTNNSSLLPPIVDFPRHDHDIYPMRNLESVARQERARGITESVDAPPGFTPTFGENQSSITFPLTYNSVLDLQVLLESSLRLGLSGTRANSLYPLEGNFMGAFALPSSSQLGRTVHTQVDYIHCLVPDLLAITNCGFYWGKMDRFEAERLLENRPEGTFLLRDSAQEEYLFSVSFRRYGRSLHARIEQWKHKFSFDAHDPGVFASDTVCGLIEHYKDPSCCMFFEPLLTNPLARTFPFPLQHLCRATVCSKVSYDDINDLELPKSFKNYLKEYHYKQRVRVRHLD